MGLFQKSVLKKHLVGQDKKIIEKTFKKYKKYFHNREIQENIKKIKEEQFQATFLTELFVNIFEYTLNPKPKYNLTTEFKNEKGAKRADGAILKNGKALAVIELKGTKTKNLESIRQQAFDYKANQSACIYVVTSNFEKIRFYINNAVDYEEFNLFTLNQEQFAILYLCLHRDNLLNNIPFQIKKDSLVSEEKITKKLYADYSLFKRELFRDLVKQNMKNEVFRAELENEDKDRASKNIKLSIFKKSQKLIDRFLFIFFAEDRGLLPPNSTLKILEQWDTLKDLDENIPLYNRYIKYFNYLDTGRKRTEKRAEIFAYNGGLFKPDTLLDSFIISDELLYKHTKKLSLYDFESQVDVNILGHIFENSLNEIESVNAEIEGFEFNKQKTKRKKDGVFYTPKYITKYIVDNTIGQLCTNKKNEIGFVEDEYLKSPKGRPKSKLEDLRQILKKYREWLLSLTIIDPACGSGAFLNQAIDFLIKEHKYIDELQANLFGQSIVFQDIENTILEKNIYGVDLNQESVEIAKLSLWLRTAQPRRKLNTLNNNIKCGNSLIDSKSVAGNKAFNWQEEFPEVFANGGFDVVIGNPPYVQSHSLDEKTKDYIYKKFKTSEYQINTYAIFVEKILGIVKENATYSIIIPNYWLSTKYDSRLRKLVFLENHCLEILNVFSVFDSATVDTVILTGLKSSDNIFPKTTKVISLNQKLQNITERLSAIDSNNWAYSSFVKFKNMESDTLISFEEKLKLNGEFILGDFFFFKKGMQPYEKGKGNPIQTREMMNDRVYHSQVKIDDTYKHLLKARNIQRYYLNETSGYIKYGKNLAAPRKIDMFQGSRILINRILSKKTIDGVYIEDEFINNSDIFNLIPKKEETNVKALFAFVVNRVCSTFFRKENVNLSRAAFPKINVNTLERFPIPKLTSDDTYNLEKKVDDIITKTKRFKKIERTFSKYIKSQFPIEKLSKKLQSWYDLEFGDFIKELNKAIKKGGGAKLTKTDEMEWMEVFEENKTKALSLKIEIDKIDKQIDLQVYKLYGLTYAEVLVVEEGFELSEAEYEAYAVE